VHAPLAYQANTAR